ncbi:hypothetical protein Ocin01_01339 [Orchesella cincta]|uniref:Uncharacterized protein n=1 Tax=Orchesella cincta TaxID=48709 RepID=A0A1D2NJ77_ORCCI|nr:hypothetical protein Ocin01_01339 [Orchesella cincta]
MSSENVPALESAAPAAEPAPQRTSQSSLPQQTETEPQPRSSQSQPHKGSTGKAQRGTYKNNIRPLKSFKDMNPMLDSWYFDEVNKRLNKDVDLFRNYQINPYTKKTLDYVTPKITERKRTLPTECECGKCDIKPEDQKLCEDHKLIRESIYKSINVPKCKFCEPQTELMRLGWFPDYVPPPTNNACLYIKTPWNSAPCCYFYPRLNEPKMNENYDERFRAVHQTAEFIKTETQLRKFDSIMNPEGYRGQVRTQRILPGPRMTKNVPQQQAAQPARISNVSNHGGGGDAIIEPAGKSSGGSLQQQ